MPLPSNVIVNADDFGLNTSVNKAILFCYECGYINSTSIFAVTPIDNLAISEAIELIHTHDLIKNVGVHINLDEGKPLTNFNNKDYLTEEGHWDPVKTKKKTQLLNKQTKNSFIAEIEAQILKIKESNVKVTHIDSHHHLHTLPAFYNLFLDIADRHNLKLRKAQTFNEGSYIKAFFRKYINLRMANKNCNYTDLFETMDYFLSHGGNVSTQKTVELMLHPVFDNLGSLTDHYMPTDMLNWLTYIS